MNIVNPPPLESSNNELSSLIATLAETEQRLEEITAGEIDAVADAHGRTFLLRRAQDQLRQGEADKQAAILNALPAHIALLDNRGVIVAVNEAWRQFADTKVIQRPGYAIGLNYLDICRGARGNRSSKAQQVAKGVRSVLDGKLKSFSLDYPDHLLPEQRWFRFSATPFTRDSSMSAVIAHLDITEERQAKDESRRLAFKMIHSSHHDVLTGLPNRALLGDRITQAIALAKRSHRRVAVLFLDLDGFKHTNDSLGHSIGDKLLRSIAKRLLTCVRSSDTVSRQGGDEFVVLLSETERAEDADVAAARIERRVPGIPEPDLLFDAGLTAGRLLEVVGQSHLIGRHDLHITASIGISVYPDDGLDAETLIKNADTAMYQAKGNGPQSFQFFSAAMNERAVERQSIERDLRTALSRDELLLYYQPKIDLSTGAITGAEALIRWVHPIRGMVPPLQFIPVAEACGLIVPIGSWVLHEACKQTKVWADAGLPAMTIAVNVSALEFRNEGFLDGLFAILSETGLDPKMLEVELTEGVLMARVDSTASLLKTLRESGVKVSIDDFGTGYSSLSYLRKFPVDTLKIDKSFVSQIKTAVEDRAIVGAVIAMGQSLNLRVVAEGVETQDELEFLRAHQCDEAQGYYFSRPVPAEQFAALLKTGIGRDHSGGNKAASWRT
jgi:predicted signal transduction protein with EAL and GGDEF domain